MRHVHAKTSCAYCLQLTQNRYITFSIEYIGNARFSSILRIQSLNPPTDNPSSSQQTHDSHGNLRRNDKALRHGQNLIRIRNRHLRKTGPGEKGNQEDREEPYGLHLSFPDSKGQKGWGDLPTARESLNVESGPTHS